MKLGWQPPSSPNISKPGVLSRLAQASVLSLSLLSATSNLACKGPQPAYSTQWSAPSNARLITWQETDTHRQGTVSFIAWENNQFVEQEAHFTFTNGPDVLISMSTPQPITEKRKLFAGKVDNHFITGQLSVDPETKTIQLPNGNRIDGPSGNLLDSTGATLTLFSDRKDLDCLLALPNQPKAPSEPDL